MGQNTRWHDVLVHRDEFLKWFEGEFPELGRHPAKGKVPVLIEWLHKKYEGKPVPDPSFAPRKTIRADALKENPVLGNILDEGTLKKAIDEYNKYTADMKKTLEEEKD